MIAIFLINSIIVAIAVMLHAQILGWLAVWVPKLGIAPKVKIVLSVFGIIVAHTMEVWLFALAYFGLISFGNIGSISGNFDGSLMDCSYFSFTTFTTLGVGDIEPMGHIRFLVGLEALAGLVLITWSASFLYLEMRRFRGDEKPGRQN